MTKELFIILFFACFGITCEIFFVALTNLYNKTPFNGEPLWSLTGKTYVWMFPIYALIPVFAGGLMSLVLPFHFLLRWLIYAVIILGVEFIAGFILKKITGKCPWEYTTGWHIMGFIRLDYIPAWMFFSAIIEYLYLFLDKNLV